MLKSLLNIVLILGLPLKAVEAQNIIRFDESDNELKLKSCFETAGGENLDQLTFRTATQLYPIINNNGQKQWVRFHIQSDKEVEVDLFLRSPHSSQVTFYMKRKKGKAIQLTGHKSVTGGFIQPVLLEKGVSTVMISSTGYLPYLSYPISIISSNKSSQVLNRQTLSWGFFMGLIFMLGFVMLGLSILIKITPYTITSIWTFCTLFLFAWQKGLIFSLLPIELNETAKTATFFFLRGMTILTFLFLIRKITVLESKSHPVYKAIFTNLLIVATLFQLMFLFLSFVSPKIIQEYQQLSLILFWVLVIVSFGLCLAWLIRALQRNRSFGYFFLTFFLPFASFGLSNANNFYALTDTVASVPLMYCIGLFLQLMILLAMLISEVIKEVKQGVVLETEPTKPIRDTLLFEDVKQLEQLTNREYEVFKAYCNGFTYQEISDAFFISPNTVRTHLKNIYRKLNINSKAEGIHLLNNSLD